MYNKLKNILIGLTILGVSLCVKNTLEVKALELNKNTYQEINTPREIGVFIITNSEGALLRTAPVPSYTPVAWYPQGYSFDRIYSEPNWYNGVLWYYVQSSDGRQKGYVKASDGVRK